MSVIEFSGVCGFLWVYRVDKADPKRLKVWGLFLLGVCRAYGVYRVYKGGKVWGLRFCV